MGEWTTHDRAVKYDSYATQSLTSKTMYTALMKCIDARAYRLVSVPISAIATTAYAYSLSREYEPSDIQITAPCGFLLHRDIIASYPRVRNKLS